MTAALSIEEIERQCAEARAASPRHVAPSWWDEDVAANMADWIRRFVPEQHRRAFIYGMSS